MNRLFPSVISTLTFLSLISTAAFAQERSLTFQVDRFEPMPSQGTNTLNIAKSDLLPAGSPSAGIFLNYASNSFQIKEGDKTVAKLLESQLRSDFWASIGVFDFFDIGFVLPVVLTQSGRDLGSVGFSGEQANGGPLLGDLRVVPKLRLLDGGDSGIGFAILPTIGIPSGNDVFNSDGGIKFEPRAVLDWRSKGGYGLSLNGAYLFRPQRVLANYVSDDVVRWGAAIEIPLMSDLKVIASGFGDIGLVKDQADGLANPYETDAAVQYTMGDFVMLLGGGAGINNGVGNPDFRVFGSFGYTPMAADIDGDGISDSEDKCPQEAEDIDGFEDLNGCPDLDNDNDGIADKDDLCTDEAEDKDGFEDEDGCPENDNDKDGVGDGQDKCPNLAGLAENEGCPDTDSDKDGVANDVDKCPDKAEDKDGFEDEDGCPESDNDADGILDADDKCPNKAEDKDGFEDADGCPDLDNDKDGFPDATDQCPNKAEVINGNKDDDGCPDKGKTKVKITKNSIKILDRVFFASGKAKIKKRSFNLLNQVSAILKTNPQITKIRVEGHTDDRGKDASNLSLSQKRAESVVKYLSESGVKTERLVATGYGETKPVASNKSKSGRASNRRVEFNILELNGKPMAASKEVVIEKKVEEKAPVKKIEKNEKAPTTQPTK